jgi:hypothetical protein
VHETRLAVIDDGGALWIQSAHHFRGWYDRLLLNPQVELVRNGEVRAYDAVPIDTPETEARVGDLLKQRGAFRFYLIRALLLFADIKPVRLDPRGHEPAVRQGAAAERPQRAPIGRWYNRAAERGARPTPCGGPAQLNAWSVGRREGARCQRPFGSTTARI